MSLLRWAVGTAAVLAWCGCFYFGWSAAVLAGGAVMLAWIDGYLLGRKER